MRLAPTSYYRVKTSPVFLQPGISPGTTWLFAPDINNNHRNENKSKSSKNLKSHLLVVKNNRGQYTKNRFKAKNNRALRGWRVFKSVGLQQEADGSAYDTEISQVHVIRHSQLPRCILKQERTRPAYQCAHKELECTIAGRIVL